VTGGEDSRPEFSRRVPLSRLNRGPVSLRLEADAEERQGLAARFGLIGLDRLEATVTLHREAGQSDVRLNGHIEGVVTQPCVVTLEPFSAPVADDFVLRYVARGSGTAKDLEAEAEVECDLQGEDIEMLSGETVDVGEAVAQYFCLALDPHPRAPRAAVPAEISGAEIAGAEIAGDATVDEAAGGDGPFAALAGLRSGARRSGSDRS